MKKVTIFEFVDYRKYLVAFVEESKKAKSSWTFSRLAKAANVNRSYLSQVLSADAKLNSDQGFWLGSAIGLQTHELEYLSLLIEIDRSNHKGRKQFLASRRDDMRHQYLKSEQVLGDHFVKVADLSREQYYRDAYYTLAHMFLTIEKYRSDPALIGRALGVSEERLEEIIDTLVRCGIVIRDSNSIQLTEYFLHLDRDSPLIRNYGTSFRQRAIEHLARGAGRDDHFLNIGFAANEATRQQIRSMFLKFFESVSDAIGPAPCENVYVMNFDLFRID